MRKTIAFLLTALALHSSAQNLFPVKLDNCKTDMFCLDCGDTKAGYEEDEFAKLQSQLNKELKLQGIKGAVKFQVLVDNKGGACVLSHTDQSNNPITLAIIKALNKFDKWTPAITGEKKEEKSSINLVFVIADNNITGQVERVDMDGFKKSFDRPNNPEIFNKTYVYKNENLDKYAITVWNAKNSKLPNNMNDNVSIDKDGLIWLIVEEGLVTFDGTTFKNAEQNITDKGKYFSYRAVATDNNNVKWVFGKNNVYSFDNTKWTKYDSTETGISGTYDIINNPKTGEVFFCTSSGLVIYKDGKWTTINQSRYKNLPSNNVMFAKRDSKNNIWIGTFNGTVILNESDQLSSFEKSATVLKGKCITSMDEDDNGNLYFSLYEFDRKDKQKVNNDEGIAVRYADGTFKQFTTENSGMPFNHADCVLYDKTEKVLWIATDRAGLVRFDGKDAWENYHNQNSGIPTSYISSMAFDNNGTLYLATRQGLVRIQRK